MPKKISIKDQALEALAEIKNPDGARPNNPFMFEAHLWYEVRSHAEKMLKQAWTTAEKAGVFDEDELRNKGEGLHHVMDSKNFTMTGKVSKGRETIDVDALVDEIANTCKITRTKAMLIVTRSKKSGKPVLEKRVVEINT